MVDRRSSRLPDPEAALSSESLPWLKEKRRRSFASMPTIPRSQAACSWPPFRVLRGAAAEFTPLREETSPTLRSSRCRRRVHSTSPAFTRAAPISAQASLSGRGHNPRLAVLTPGASDQAPGSERGIKVRVFVLAALGLALLFSSPSAQGA